MDSENHALYSNRALAYVTNEQFDLAMKDAEKCIELKPDWAKVCEYCFVFARILICDI